MESKRMNDGTVIVKRAELLIEPVWNRNPVMKTVSSITPGAFNRTSMESKQSINRNDRLYPTLLIEPVWNRNVVRDPVAVNMRENF